MPTIIQTSLKVQQTPLDAAPPWRVMARNGCMFLRRSASACMGSLEKAPSLRVCSALRRQRSQVRILSGAPVLRLIGSRLSARGVAYVCVIGVNFDCDGRLFVWLQG